MKKTAVQLCPSCGKASLDLYLGGYLGKMYLCRECGYLGALVVEVELGEGENFSNIQPAP